MAVIPFKPRTKILPVQPDQKKSGPQPNFEDPHSAEFFDEPRYDKAEGRMSLNQAELDALSRLRSKFELTATFHGNYIQLTKTLIAEEAGVRAINKSGLITQNVAQISKNDTDPHSLTYAYKMVQCEEGGASNSLLSLIVRLERHIETGCPDEPEIDFWR